jgi:aminoglycoside phosphotransferase (APT) family kinase protein
MQPPIATPSAEIQITNELVQQLICEQRPDLAALPLTPLAAGWDNTNYRLGNDLLVRLPHRQLAAQLVLHEQTWLPQLAPRLPLPIPAPIHNGTPTANYPWHWSISAWLSGEDADQHSLAPDQGQRFGEFLRQLHQAAPSNAPHNPYRGVPLQHRQPAQSQRLDRLASVIPEQIEQLRALWHTALAAPIDIAPTWLHGDLHPRNLLVHQGQISGVIDWGDLCSGDPANDLAAAWLVFDQAATRQAFWQAYGPINTATHQRAQGWAVAIGTMMLETGLADNPRNAQIGRKALHNLLADLA